MLNKVVLLMGRGVEGCGVTKFCIELQKHLEGVGTQCELIAIRDKMWARNKSHKFHNMKHIRFAVDEEYTEAVKLCKEADVVIVNSLPSIVAKVGGVGTDELATENFLKLLETTPTPVVMVQHDHNKLSLRRNAGTGMLINRAAVLFAHSKTGDFAAQVQDATGTGGGLSEFFGESAKEIKTFQPAFDFDLHRDKYWKPIEKQDSMLGRWIGRTTFWKGFVPMFEFHNNYLKADKFLTVFEGIEKSPAFMDFRTKSEFHNFIKKKPDLTDLSPYYGDHAVVFTYYKNEEMLERLSKSAFGYQLSLLAEKYVDKSIEYTHCEIPAVGVVPVFRKEFGDRCHHRVNGDPLTKSKNSGTIWLPTNKDEMAEAHQHVKLMSIDHGYRNEMREEAFEFYKAHQDAQYVFPDMMKEIENALH